MESIKARINQRGFDMYNLLLTLGFMDAFTGGKKGSLKYYEKKLYEFQEQEAETLIDIGVLYLEKNDISKALKNFNEALIAYQKIDYPEGVAYTFDLIGDTYLSVRNTGMALKNYKKSLEVYASVGSPLEEEMKEKVDEVIQINESMGIDSELDDFEENDLLSSSEENVSVSKEYFDGDYFDESTLGSLDSASEILEESAISEQVSMEKLAEKLEESIMLLENSETYSVYYKESKESDIEYLKEALSTAEIIDDVEGQGTLHLMIGDNDLRNENTAKALDHFNQARKLFEKNDNKRGIAISMILMGSVFFVLDEKEEMYELFKNSFNMFREIKYKKGEIVARDLIEMLSS